MAQIYKKLMVPTTSKGKEKSLIRKRLYNNIQLLAWHASYPCLYDTSLGLTMDSHVGHSPLNALYVAPDPWTTRTTKYLSFRFKNQI